MNFGRFPRELLRSCRGSDAIRARRAQGLGADDSGDQPTVAGTSVTVLCDRSWAITLRLLRGETARRCCTTLKIQTKAGIRYAPCVQSRPAGAHAEHATRCDQDGTDHGNTQSTVRDPLPRHVIMFYYAQDTTLDMGPTSIIPGSQYYSVDRLGAGSSEHSLATDLYDNTDEDLARRDAGIQSAGTILSHSLEQAEALRQARIAGKKIQQGSDTELFQEKKLTVCWQQCPAVLVVILPAVFSHNCLLLQVKRAPRHCPSTCFTEQRDTRKIAGGVR